MSDTLDVLTLAEARAVLNIQSSDTSQDAELAGYITAVSRRLDDICGAIVIRAVTETHDGGNEQVFLDQAPIGPSAATTVTSVTEYSGGTATALSVESLTVVSDSAYRFDIRLGTLTRRSNWATWPFASQAVVVVYSPGRYATTAAVDQKFKQAAGLLLQHLWRPSQGVAGSSTFGAGAEQAAGVPGFGVPNAVIELLADELRPITVAGA